ncbi:MAG: hypothetical protein JWM05_704, partial [Acidimicrobiales bacterium]|nr:hypothetical protein [Acidimicrobiales bacterium]
RGQRVAPEQPVDAASEAADGPPLADAEPAAGRVDDEAPVSAGTHHRVLRPRTVQEGS